MRELLHENFMRRAVTLAARGVGKTRPNPAVGCIIVKDGAVVGSGWHRKAGTPHAEIHALKEAGEAVRGADVYVTLEPCSHHGKTPPCADALIRAGIGRLFVGMIDPNPLVSGQGMKRLQEAGIPCHAGILEKECRLLNEPFIKHMTTQLPFVTLKLAMSLDGKIATATGDSKWITCEKSRMYVHKLRGMADAVLVGSDTVIADNPLLNVRLTKGTNPLRVVVDSRLRTPSEAAVFDLNTGGATILATIDPDPLKHAPYSAHGVQVICCAAQEGRVDLSDLLIRLGARGVQSILLEGGGTLAGEALRRHLVDKVCLFYAPIILGGDGKPSFAGAGASFVAEAIKLRDLRSRKIGSDMLVEGYPE